MATLWNAGIFEVVESRLRELEEQAYSVHELLNDLYTRNSNDTEIRSLITRLRHAQIDAETVTEDITYMLNKLTTANLLSDDE